MKLNITCLIGRVAAANRHRREVMPINHVHVRKLNDIYRLVVEASR